MKSFLIITACLLIAAASGQKYKAGKKVYSRGGRISTTLTADVVCPSSSNKNQRFCNAPSECDASGLILCTGVGKGLNLGCAGDLPYCSNEGYGSATCVATRPASCAPTASDFVCLAEGVFPDPTNCQNYINCVGYGDDNFYADLYRCDTLYVFDPSAPIGFNCRLQDVAAPNCVTVDCSKTPLKNIVLTYPNFNISQGEIVATCLGEQMPLVTRCPAGFRANLALLPPVCNIVCSSAGLFEYPGDKTQFYECLLTPSGWAAKARTCFRGYAYNKKTKACDIPYTP